MSLIAKIEQLNNADLSKLSGRLAQLRAEMERDLSAKPATPSGGTGTGGITAEQLLKDLKKAQRSAS